MAKKENAKAGKKSKLEAAVTEAEKDSVNPVAEEIKAEAPKTVEESVETPVQAEPTEAVQEEQAGEIGERAPAEEAVEERAPAEEAVEECAPAEEAVEAPAFEQVNLSPRRSIAFIGSECYPFVKTGGLGDVMYALPKALVKQNCDVKVILPRYKCIPWEYQQKMIYRGSFGMDLCADGLIMWASWSMSGTAWCMISLTTKSSSAMEIPIPILLTISPNTAILPRLPWPR